MKVKARIAVHHSSSFSLKKQNIYSLITSNKSLNMYDDASIITSYKNKIMTPKKRASTVVSTLSLHKYKLMGEKHINQYVLSKTLGEGSFASVRLCTDSNT